MEAKRGNMQTIAQYNSAGHRINPGLSKTQVAVGIFILETIFFFNFEQEKMNEFILFSM